MPLFAKSGTAVNSADAMGKPKGNKIEGVAAKPKSVSFAPLKKRNSKKLGVVLEEGRKKAKVQTIVDIPPRRDGGIPPTQGCFARSTVVNQTKTKFPSRIYHPDARAFYRMNNGNACPPFREIDLLTTEFDRRYMYM